MRFQEMLMKFALTWVLVAAAAFAATQEFPIAKPGCRERCGNISIPYPFGLTKDCYLNRYFLIRCNETFDPPRAFLTNSSIIVTEITLDGKLHILQSVVRDCYNTTSGAAARDNNRWSMLRLSKFVVSDTDNMFAAIGCNTEATVLGSLKADSDYVYKVGCMSMCNSLEYVPNNTCSGIGCCQTSLAKGVRYLNVTVSSYQIKPPSTITGFSPCSYAFIIETRSFKFASKNFSDLRSVKRLPLVLDWNIGDSNCTTVINNTMKSACQGNSTCQNPGNGYGYICKCLDGYQGNPYLSNGCQGIISLFLSFINFFSPKVRLLDCFAVFLFLVQILMSVKIQR